MRYASLCSGIEAATVAWKPLGWSCAWLSEIDRFPCAVLQHHYPDTPNLGDMTKINKEVIEDHGAVDVLIGGTPCQSFSVAGLRKGLDDPRGNLALDFLRIVDAARPKWVVWENVPGVLSSRSGEPPCTPPDRVGVGPGEQFVDEVEYVETDDFRCFTAALTELWYGWAYRTLDAQYFGVAQRRRRVFVVGHLGDWQRATAVLFEREGLSGHPAPSREAGTGVAARTARGVGTCGADDNQAQAGHLIEVPTTSPALKARDYKGPSSDGDGDGDGAPIIPVAFDTTQITSDKNYSNPKPGDPSHPLARGAHAPAIAYRTSGNCGVMEQGDRTAALNCNTDPNQNIVGEGMAVRRLTPRECERLQGFPDDYTLIPYRNKPADQCPDGPRYKALGNSMAVPVIRWLGERIEQVMNCSQANCTTGDDYGSRTGNQDKRDTCRIRS